MYNLHLPACRSVIDHIDGQDYGDSLVVGTEDRQDILLLRQDDGIGKW